MVTVPRGKYIGVLIGDDISDETYHYIKILNVPSAAAVTCATSERFSITRGPCLVQRRINRNEAAAAPRRPNSRPSRWA